MDDRLKALYQIPERVLEQDICIENMRIQCADMEYRVMGILEKLSTEDRQIVETFLEMRDELEFQCVKIALRFSKYVK